MACAWLAFKGILIVRVWWRDADLDVQSLLPSVGVKGVVLAGNSSWMARRVSEKAREDGFLVLAATAPEDQLLLGYWERAAGWQHLDRATAASLDMAVVALAALPASLPVILGTGLAAGLSPFAVRWLQSLRERGHVVVEVAELLEQLPRLEVLIVDERPYPSNAFLSVLEAVDRRRFEGEPLVVVVAVGQPLRSDAWVTDDAPQSVRRLAHWCEERVATWRWVAPLNLDQVQEALSCDALVASQLLEVSDGDDAVAEEVWAQWHRSGRVVFVDGRWQATDALVGESERFIELFDSLKVSSAVARELLWLASRFGMRFCAASVVEAQARLSRQPPSADGARWVDTAQVSIETLLDVFDDLVDRDVMILEGRVLDERSETCWIYRFVSRGDRARARRLRRDESGNAVTAVLAAAIERHRNAYVSHSWPEEQQIRPLDGELAQLATELGEHEAASYFRRRADRWLSVDELTTHLAVLLAASAEWEPGDQYPFNELVAAAHQAYVLGQFAVAQVAASQAYLMADQREKSRIVGLQDDEAPAPDDDAAASPTNLTPDGDPPAVQERRESLAIRSSEFAQLAQLLGRSHAEHGYFKDSLEGLHLARLRYRQLAESHPSPAHTLELALAERDLSRSVREVHGHEVALEGLIRSRELSRRLADSHPSPAHTLELALAERDVAVSVREVHGHEVALEGLIRSRDLQRQLADSHPSPIHTRCLAVAEGELSRSVREVHGHEVALEGLIRSRDLQRQLADSHPSPIHTHELATAEQELARSVREVHGHEDALEGLTRSRDLSRQLAESHPSAIHTRVLAVTEGELARSVREVHGDEDALEGLTRSRDLLRHLAESHPYPAYTLELAIAEGELARSVREVHGDEDALEGLTRSRDLSRQLADSYPSAAHTRGLAIAEGDLARSVRELYGDEDALKGLIRSCDLHRQLANNYPSPTHTLELAVAEQDLALSVREVHGERPRSRG